MQTHKVTSATHQRVLAWWADLFGVPVTDVFRASTVTAHARLGDYPGWFGAWRHGARHLSHPSGTAEAAIAIAAEIPLQGLGVRESWNDVVPSPWVLVGPSVHHYADHSTLLRAHTDGLEIRRDAATDGELRRLRESVSRRDWEEAGFDDEDLVTFFVQKSGIVVAAANLTHWCDGYTDVGVLVRPDHRGRGLGVAVASAAADHAVRTEGIARWRARGTNLASLATARRLGFVSWCDQLAVRPG